MQFSKFAALAAVGLVCVAGQATAMEAVSAQAATVKGQVMVERGGRVISLTPSMALNPGDRIVSTAGAQAQIKFADGCQVPVSANTIATVGAQSPCAAAGLAKSSSPMDFGGEYGNVILGFLAVGLVVWGVYEASDNGNESLSP